MFYANFQKIIFGVKNIGVKRFGVNNIDVKWFGVKRFGVKWFGVKRFGVKNFGVENLLLIYEGRIDERFSKLENDAKFRAN